MKIILFGQPGAGKGTQAQLLSKKFNIPHISTGEIFRQHMQNHTPLGEEVREVMESGNLVSDELTIRIAEDAIKNLDGWVLDGYPRSRAQAIEIYSKFPDAKYIGLIVDRETSIERIKERAVKIYRPEDASEENIATRFNSYFSVTVPGIAYIKSLNKLIEIDGSYSIDEVFNRILKNIEHNCFVV